MAAFSPQPAPRGPFGHSAAPTSHGAPVGTFAPGTKVQVGGHRVVIEKYLSEGGFAHVYVVGLPKPVDGADTAVLKRVAVPDKEHLANMRTEVETMKKLKGHRRIVRYIDSHASQLKGGGYEVFLLMEYCPGGGLIDFMNTRLKDRLTEPEILKIFADVTEGLACMHYLRPPLLHRDLKVENVLISGSGSTKTYKLCDFGSAAPPRPAASSATEGRLIEDDVQRHTTLQYRSPEMIDVYRKQPIDEKSDIWALGVFLYKLCYYTTPFEDVGQMAILNASFKYPAYPPFSDRLKLLIATMLRESPAKRPNIYQILQQACSMQGKPVPVADIYTGRSQSEDRKSQQMPPSSEAKAAAVGAMLSPPSDTKPTAVPEVAPMRRGRPTSAVSHHGSAQHSPSPLRMIDQSDPFSLLDGSKAKARDELSSRFPTLDQFSLLTEKGQYDFEPPSAGQPEIEKSDLSQRVLNALADDAFAQPSQPDLPRPTKLAPPNGNLSSSAAVDKQKSFEQKRVSTMQDQRISTDAQKPAMVSAGTMTLPSPPPLREKPVHRFPPTDHEKRAVSLPGPPENHRPLSGIGKCGSRLSNLLSQDAAKSQSAIPAEPKSPSSSRPSLEGARPPIVEPDISVSRSKSTNSKGRPASINVISKFPSNGDRALRKTSAEEARQPPRNDLPPLRPVESDKTITSDVEFLRAKEDEVKTWKGGKRHSGSSGHQKRGSLPSISLSGTKNILSGRFGDAFRRFEGGGNGPHRRSSSSSPSLKPVSTLTPVEGSEATDLSEDRPDLDEKEDMSPEARRELERRRLSAEERRVADAAAHYREWLAQKNGEGGRDLTKAVSIQNKVQSLLKENDDPATGAAADYGRFANSDGAPQVKKFAVLQHPPANHPSRIPPSPRASVPVLQDGATPPQEPRSIVTSPSNVPPSGQVASKPTAPPKPFRMRTGAGEATTSPTGASTGMDNNPAVIPSDEWEHNFSKRYPSLSGFEMVETEIARPKVATIRTKEI